MEHNKLPKHTHYVSLENGVIHPALTHPSGYEDQFPAEWRPATAAEVDRYRAGSERGNTASVSLDAVVIDPALQTPGTIELAPDPPAPPPPSPVQEAPTIPPAVPPAPAAE